MFKTNPTPPMPMAAPPVGLAAANTAGKQLKTAKAPHPRTHALTMASASHLHSQGYISGAQHQSIRGQAQAKMDAAKGQGPAAPPAVFGALAPR